MEPTRTPLSHVHEHLGARMVPFAGYWMPVQYTSILDEARHVRRAAGLFDLCHMGRVRVRGADAVEAIHRLVSSDVRGMKPGVIRYGLLTREDGTILDDVLVYREDDGLFLCINASNRARDLAWMRTWCAGLDAAIEDLSDELAMLALQGPTSIDVARAVCDPAPDRLGYYRLTRATVLGVPDVMVSRTGYTGEDGFEFYFPAGEAERFWNGLMEAGAGAGLTPIGLGARDTLRLEAGMPLYGHEIDDSTTPVEAGLLWACDRTWEFVGGPAIREVAERGAARRLIGFTCQGRRVPREGYPILSGDQVIGEVRSGTLSPTLDLPIGTAYVPVATPDGSAPADLAVDCRGSRTPIEIVDLPFYNRRRA